MTVSILSLIFMLVLGTNVGATSAGTNVGVSENPPADAETENTEGLSTLGLGKPTKSHNLKSSGEMKFSGSAANSNLYTNKYFTGASSVSIEVRNFRDGKLKYKLYKKGTIGAVGTFTLNAKQSQISVRNLDSKGQYYIKFYGPSNFSGSVKAN